MYIGTMSLKNLYSNSSVSTDTRRRRGFESYDRLPKSRLAASCIGTYTLQGCTLMQLQY